MGGVYLLSGVPETVELCLNVAGGLVDTHVLMTLAALGLLALGQASEVSKSYSAFWCTHLISPCDMSAIPTKCDAVLMIDFVNRLGLKISCKLLFFYCMTERKF